MESIDPLLQRLSVEELKELLNNDDRIDDLLKEDKQIRALENKRDTMIASNKSLAEFNLSREPAYREARQALVDVYRSTLEMKNEVESKREKLQELSRQTSMDTTLAVMQTAAAEAEEESEKIASQFLDKEMTVDSFLSTFIPNRKTAHMRRVKVDKLMEYMRNPQRQMDPIRSAPPPPSSLPYPTVPTGPFPYPQSSYPPY